MHCRMRLEINERIVSGTVPVLHKPVPYNTICSIPDFPVGGCSDSINAKVVWLRAKIIASFQCSPTESANAWCWRRYRLTSKKLNTKSNSYSRIRNIRQIQRKLKLIRISRLKPKLKQYVRPKETRSGFGKDGDIRWKESRWLQFCARRSWSALCYSSSKEWLLPSMAHKVPKLLSFV